MFSIDFMTVALYEPPDRSEATYDANRSGLENLDEQKALTSAIFNLAAGASSERGICRWAGAAAGTTLATSAPGRAPWALD